MSKTFFLDDIKKGTKGEEKFCKLYFDIRNIQYKDVSNDPVYQKRDIDFVTDKYSYEVKTNYNNDGKIFIEEYTNINEDLGKISEGWIKKSKADFLAVVSKSDNTILLFNFKELKKRYETIKDNYPLIKNKISSREDENQKWQSAFRQVDLKDFEGLYLEV